MNTKEIESKILELASEDAYGSWELWGDLSKDISNKDKDFFCSEFINVIEDLIKNKKLVALTHNLGESYSITEFDTKRLKFEIEHADKPVPESFYWFETTTEGKSEDITLRS